MPLLADRVKETTTTTGTGTVSLLGAPSGYQTFVGAFGTAASVYYTIAGGSQWEVGIGTTGTGTLTRDTVLASSNSGSLVNFSAGTKDVFCSYAAGRAVTTSDPATLTNKTLTAPTITGSPTINTVPYTFPSSQGAAGTALVNNGSGVLSWTAVGSSATQTIFNASGTWTKPSTGSMALVECWGAGGSGGYSNSGSGGNGGGGGGYTFRVFRLADLPATATVTVGAGGAAQSGASSAFGQIGGGSDFYGGSTALSVSVYGGDGGAPFVSSTLAWGGTPQGFGPSINFTSTISPSAAVFAGDRIFNGGFGAGISSFSGSTVVTQSVYGGGGGASVQTSYGTSVYGGNGGAMNTAGSVPGGGGGAGDTSPSGAGGNGRVTITVW